MSYPVLERLRSWVECMERSSSEEFGLGRAYKGIATEEGSRAALGCMVNVMLGVHGDLLLLTRRTQ